MEYNINNVNHLDLNEVEIFLKNQGYNVLFLKQIWRHVHGKLEKNNQIFFLKMSSDRDIGYETENEVSWNEKISPLMEGLYIKIPKIYMTGKYKESFYYIGEFFEGDLLTQKDSFDIKKLNNHLDKIIKFNIFLLSLDEIKFHTDIGNKEDAIKNYIKKIEKRYRELKEYDIEKIFLEVQGLKNQFVCKINHGDFVPRHFINVDDQLILIDGEHASAYLPKYYDISYFYERVYARVNFPELAKKYLKSVYESLPETDQKTFIKDFRPVLASRIITGIHNLVFLDNTKNISSYKKLAEDLFKNNLY